MANGERSQQGPALQEAASAVARAARAGAPRPTAGTRDCSRQGEVVCTERMRRRRLHRILGRGKRVARRTPNAGGNGEDAVVGQGSATNGARGEAPRAVTG